MTGQNPKSPTEVDEFTWGTAALLLCVGAAFVFAGWFFVDMAILEPRRLAKKAESWTEVPCTIRVIEVEVVQISNSGQKTTNRRESSPAYAPRVEYDYVWNGKNYSSDRFWFGSSFWNSRSGASEAIAPFQSAKRTFCYVNPNDPSQAVLTRNTFERTAIDSKWVFALIASGITLVLAMVACRSFMNRRTTDTAVVKVADQMEDSHSKQPSPSNALRAWLVAILWNGTVGLVTYFTWVGGAPVSFLVFFMGLFWLAGLIMLAVAISSTFEVIRRVQARPECASIVAPLVGASVLMEYD